MSNLEAALALAGAGISVFPVQGWLDGDAAKTPCRGVRWRHESTTDKTRIARWWATWPDAAPAIDVGKSNLLVIDCDAPKSEGQSPGDVWWRDRLEEQDTIAIPVVNTPSGGRHYIFRQPEGATLGNARGSLPPKPEVAIDVRGAGGYIVAGGAILSGGRTYKPEGSIATAPVAPDWLVELLAPTAAPEPPAAPVTLPAAPMIPPSADRARAWATAALEAEFREVASLPPGARNEGLNKSAYKVGGLVGAGYITESEAYSVMAGAVVGWTDQPKTLGTLKRGLRDGAAAPRELPPEEGHNGAALAALIMSGDGRTAHDPETGEVFDLPAVVEKLEPQNAPPLLANAGEADVDLPPGLVGDVARWILATSRRPLPLHALGAALAIVGTVIGRRVAGPTFSGTHLYVVGLAPTGAGKDHPLDCCRTLLAAAGLGDHLGGSEFMSMPAVINAVTSKPLSLWPMDEFGAFLARVNSRKASGFEAGISKILRSLWGSSFKVYTSPEWAGRSAGSVHAPALSIYGVSTAEEFYRSLQGADVTNGLLNRLLVLPVDRAPADRDPGFDPRKVPESLVERVRDLYLADGEFAASQRNVSSAAPVTDDATWGAGAREAFEHLIATIEERQAADPNEAPHYARTAETAVRIATIIAAGRNSMVVEYDDMTRGREIAMMAADWVLQGAREHMAENDNQANANLVARIIKAAGGRMVHGALARALRNRIKPRDLRDLLAGLADAGTLLIDEKPAAEGSAGRPAISYVLVAR